LVRVAKREAGGSLAWQTCFNLPQLRRKLPHRDAKFAEGKFAQKMAKVARSGQFVSH